MFLHAVGLAHLANLVLSPSAGGNSEPCLGVCRHSPGAGGSLSRASCRGGWPQPRAFRLHLSDVISKTLLAGLTMWRLFLYTYIQLPIVYAIKGMCPIRIFVPPPPKAQDQSPTGRNIDISLTPFPKLRHPLHQMVYGNINIEFQTLVLRKKCPHLHTAQLSRGPDL